MSTLTDDQRRRMEENRRKALEKRAAATAARTEFSSVNGATGFNPNVVRASGPAQVNQNLVPGDRYNHDSSSSAKMFRPNTSTSSNNFQRANAPQVPSAQTSFNSSILSRDIPKSTASVPQQGRTAVKTLTGSSILISRERFKVEVGYNQQLLEIFRTIKGHQYDAKSKTWTFPFSEHSTLVSAVSSLRPMVAIGPLPNFVLRVFRNVKPGVPRTIPSVEIGAGRIDKTLMNALMPFQLDGVKFGISRKGRCLISDDMGLGKTIQALGIAHYYFNEWPLLITCPSSMRYAWRESIWKWLPSVPAESIYVVETGKDSIDNAKVVITSYDMLQKRSEDFSRCGVIIMDESHHLKNPKTARTKAAVPLMQKAKRLILLSGTPALSRPIELYTQIAAIDKNLFYVMNEFGIRYCSGTKNHFGWDFSGSSNMEELQLILEETIMIRRLKSDVLMQLPAKMRKVLLLDPLLVKTKNNKSLKATAAAFNSVKKCKAAERRGKLLEYYSETSIAKLDAVTAYIKELIEDKKKFICFAHHKTMMDGISEMLEKMRTRYIRIDGAASAEDRQRAVDIFQHDDDVLVAVLSITAASTGITLTAASLVVFAELYWNPGILTQAEDRAHRIGQEDSVLVEYLVAGGTADDVIWPLVQKKLEVLNRAGLSKDNFDVDATALVQRTVQLHRNTVTNQRKMDEYVVMSQSQDNANADIQDEFMLENDSEILQQLLEDSFN